MNNILSKKTLINSIFILLILSIILDLHVFYNSVSTLIRVLLISIIFLIIFIKYSTKSERKILIIYFLFLSIFVLFHVINAYNYKISIYTKYDTLSELLYIFKMISNLLIIYIVYKLGIDFKKIIKIIKILIWFISGSIVLSNIFCIGYTTYDFNYITENIFSWFFSKNISFDRVSGKGFFHMANQIIAILILYYPLLISEIKINFKKSDIILSSIVLISMLILGNRLSSYVPLIILLVMLVVYFVFVLLNLEEKNHKFVVFSLTSMVLYIFLLFFSPLVHRQLYYENIMKNNNINLQNNNNVYGQSNLKQRFIEKKINLNFPFKYYKYEKDKYFWEKLLLEDRSKLIDNRYIEISIIERIKSLNKNNFDTYFGIGYNRIINIHNIEKDYIMQYYSVGIIGFILLLGIYFFILVYSIFKIVISIENKLNFCNFSLLLSCCLFLISAYFSGNILNSISTIIPISVILGILLNEATKKNNINKTILGFEISSETKEKLIKNIEHDIKIKKQIIIYNANPLIIMNFFKNPNFKIEFNSSKYKIPDGIGIVYAAKMKNINISKRITGIDFFECICKLAAKKGLSIYLYGGKDGVAKKVKENLEKKYKNIKIIGTMSGYNAEKFIINDIKKSKPNILFIATGSPKQEMFIMENKKELRNQILIMPVGGTFDVVSGNKKRAPKVFINLHLEWFYRMIKEPKRIKTNIKLLKFLILVIFKNNCYNDNCKGEQIL